MGRLPAGELKEASRRWFPQLVEEIKRGHEEWSPSNRPQPTTSLVPSAAGAPNGAGR